MANTTITVAKLKDTSTYKTQEGFEVQDGVCVITAAFVNSAASSEFPLNEGTNSDGTPIVLFDWRKATDAQKLIKVFKERSHFLGSYMTASATVNQSCLSASNFAKLQQVYTNEDHIKHLLHPDYKEPLNSASGISFSNVNFPTFSELNTTNGSVDEGSYQWWYELCKYAGLIETDPVSGIETWGFSYYNGSSIVRPGVAGLNAAGQGADALRVTTAGDIITPAINKRNMEDLLALAQIEHSQKIRVTTPGHNTTNMSTNNTVSTLSLGTRTRKKRTSDADELISQYDPSWALTSGNGSGNIYGTNDARGNHYYATNIPSAISSITTSSDSRSAFVRKQTNAELIFRAFNDQQYNDSDRGNFMLVDLEYHCGEISVTGSATGGFRPSSRGRTTIALTGEGDEVHPPIEITDLRLYVDALHGITSNFDGSQTDDSLSDFTLGWNTIDFSSHVTNIPVGDNAVGRAFINGLKINPIDDSNVVMTHMPQFTNADFSKIETSDITFTMDNVFSQNTDYSESCRFHHPSSRLSLQVTDVDGTTHTRSSNGSAPSGHAFMYPGALSIGYNGYFPHTVTARNYYISGNRNINYYNNVPIKNLPADNSDVFGVDQVWSGSETTLTYFGESSTGGWSVALTESATLTIAAGTYFEVSSTASQNFTISCEAFDPTTTTGGGTTTTTTGDDPPPDGGS